MAKVLCNFIVTEEALDKLDPSLDRPIRVENCDGKYSLGDERCFLLIVTRVNSDGEFWACTSKSNLSDGIELKGLRKFNKKGLKSYRFCKESLPKRSVVLRTDHLGRVTAYGLDGKPVTSDLLPEGVALEIPYI